MSIGPRTGHRTGEYIAAIALATIIACSPACRQEKSKTNIGFDAPHLLDIVNDYADAMIELGRDRYGTEHTPLFISAMDLGAMQPGSADDFGTIPGVREFDRSIGGSNPLNDIALYDLLYRLSEITKDDKYATEANEALDYFFSHCQSPATGLMCWGEHLSWDFLTESCAASPDHEYHEAEEWPFWDLCYQLQPDACWEFVIGEWDHQIADHGSGDFSRHARWSVHGPHKGYDFPRYAGQMIERWADAWAREENLDRGRREDLVTAIEVMLTRMEGNMNTPSGYLPAFRGADYLWNSSNLELARCLWEAAQNLDITLATRMNKLALTLDEQFLSSPHQLDTGGGFAFTLNVETLEPRSRSMNKPYTTSWDVGYGFGTHASMANNCYRRHLQIATEYPELASAYADLIILAAEQYLVSSPDTSGLVMPESFSNVIDLMLISYKLSNNEHYIFRASQLADLGIQLFLSDAHSFPHASNQHDHYESLTGGPDFMNTLLNLYLTVERME